MTEKQRRRAHRLKALAKREAFEANKPTPRPDAAERMFKKEGVDLNPLNDPLWLSDKDYEDRKRVMREMAAWEDSTAGCGLFDYYVHLNGEQHHAYDFRMWQDRTAHALLTKGLDVRAVAKFVYRPVEWVEKLEAKYRIG